MICLIIAVYLAIHESRCISVMRCRRCEKPEVFQFIGIMVDMFAEFVLLGLAWRLV